MTEDKVVVSIIMLPRKELTIYSGLLRLRDEGRHRQNAEV